MSKGIGLRRVGVVGLVTAVVGAAAVSVALALNAPATATISGDANVFSGAADKLVVDVTNPAPSGAVLQKDVAYVRITPPAEYDITGVTAYGWSATARPDRAWDLRRSTPLPVDAAGGQANPTPGVITPGETEKFVVDVTARPQAADRTDQLFKVATSEETAATTVQAAKVATGGTLVAPIRVLEVTGVSVAAPIVNATTFTESQNNIVLGVAYRNHGTAGVTVSGVATGANGDGHEPNAPTTLAAGSTGSVPVPAHVGTTGTGRKMAVSLVSSTADVTAPSVSTAAYGVVSKASFSYVTSATVAPLTPSAANSGTTTTLTLTMAKAGAATCTSLSGSRISFVNKAVATQTFAAAPVAQASCPSGNSSYTFGPVTIPGTASLADWDGTYASSVVVSGTDSNGAVISQVVPVSTDFRIDNLVPVLSPTLTSPAREAAVGESRANDTTGSLVTRSGAALTLGGTIATSATNSTRDGSVAITCAIVDTDAQFEHAVAAKDCVNTGGTISGTASPVYASGVDAVTLQVTGRDGANVAVGQSAPVLVDDIAPVLRSATTLSTTRIRVTTTEPVTGEFKAGDFLVNIPPTVAGGVPTGLPVTQATFFGSTDVYGTTVDLTLGTPIGEDALPVIQYLFLPLGGTAPIDAPGNALASSSVVAVDRIAPATAALKRVDTRTADGGVFYTNGGTATFTAGTVAPGHSVTIRFGSLSCTSTNTALFLTAPADATCSIDVSSLAPAAYPFTVQVKDRNDNLSGVTTSTVVIDRTPATIVSVVSEPATKSLLVTFSEALAGGTDIAGDWRLINGPRITYTVGSVSTVSATQRRLNVVDDDFTGAFTELTYDPAASSAYTDRAGNVTRTQTVVRTA